MADTSGTPLAELTGAGGLTHHQTKPLLDYDANITVEQLAELVDAHRGNPEGSELSRVPGFGRRRVELACAAIDQWRKLALEG